MKESNKIDLINLPFQNDDDNDDENEILDPMSHVKKFLTSQLLALLVDESNKYAAKKNIDKVLSLNKTELEQFTGMLYMVCILKISSRSKELYFDNVADVMNVNRFELIKSALHCNDDLLCPERCTGKLYKVQPLINMLQATFSIPN